MVEQRNQGQKEGGRNGKMEDTELRRGCQGEGTTPEVDSKVQEENMQQVLSKHEGGRGVESSTIHEPSGRHDSGGLNRQRRQVSKHISPEGGDAGVRVFRSG